MLGRILGDKDLRNKLMIVFIGLGIYKLGIHITVPGINKEVLESMAFGDGVLGMVNTFTGGAIESFSIFAVGIMPYITASIVVQLLQMDGIRILKEWSEQGEMGQKKLKYVTYVLAVVFALMQSVMFVVGYGRMYGGLFKSTSLWNYSLIVFVLTLGTVLLIVIGEVIEKKGIGRGISVIIFGGILMSLPGTFTQLYEMYKGTGDDWFISYVSMGLILIMVLLLTVVVIFFEGSTRRIPIQSAGGGKFIQVSKAPTYLPIKLNPAGVIPVIFASALFMMPTTVSQFIGDTKIGVIFVKYFSYGSYTGILLYAVMIIMFTYFYAFIQMDPKKLSDNLTQSGSYIPTIRPGANTEEYFKRVLVRITFVGSIFLAIISVMFMVVGKYITLPDGIIFGGTSIIIIVSVGVDFLLQLKSTTQKSRYSRFIKTKR